MMEYAPLTHGMASGLYLDRAAQAQGTIELEVPHLNSAAQVGLAPNYAKTVPRIGYTVLFGVDVTKRPCMTVERSDGDPMQLQAFGDRAFDELPTSIAIGYHREYAMWLPTMAVARALQASDGSTTVLHAKLRVFWQHMHKFAEHGTRKYLAQDGA